MIAAQLAKIGIVAKIENVGYGRSGLSGVCNASYDLTIISARRALTSATAKPGGLLGLPELKGQGSTEDRLRETASQTTRSCSRSPARHRGSTRSAMFLLHAAVDHDRERAKLRACDRPDLSALSWGQSATVPRGSNQSLAQRPASLARVDDPVADFVM